MSTLLLKGLATATVMCEYSAFKGAPSSNCWLVRKYSAFKGAPSSNCNMQVAYSAFKRAPTATVKLEKGGAMPACYRLNCYLFLASSYQLLVFSKLCIMNTLAFSDMSVML